MYTDINCIAISLAKSFGFTQITHKHTHTLTNTHTHTPTHTNKHTKLHPPALSKSMGKKISHPISSRKGGDIGMFITKYPKFCYNVFLFVDLIFWRVH